MIPGEVNVYGVALSGLPGVQIGFNDAIAWSHTVSSGHRFTLYRYDLDPADPTVYLVDGKPQPMTPNEITIEVAGADGGEPTEVTRTLWSTHHGPVISLEPLPWSTEQAIAIRDGNIDITRVLAQFFGMDMATSMDEFQQVHATEQGIPWVNTIATSADGRAWYADTAATPNLSPEALAAWEAEVAAGGLLGLAYNDFGVVMLDGSDSLFEWVDDPAAPAPGLVPFADVPQIERADYVFNANDSYWLSNPSEPLTGFSPMHGVADVPQSPRTRTNIMVLEERDGPWTADDIEAALFAERSAVAELLHQPLVDACTATPTVDLNGPIVDLTAGVRDAGGVGRDVHARRPRRDLVPRVAVPIRLHRADRRRPPVRRRLRPGEPGDDTVDSGRRSVGVARRARQRRPAARAARHPGRRSARRLAVRGAHRRSHPDPRRHRHRGRRQHRRLLRRHDDDRADPRHRRTGSMSNRCSATCPATRSATGRAS